MKTHNVHEQAVNVYSNVYLDNKIKRSNKKQVKTNVSKFVCWLFAWIAAFAKGGLWLGWILPCGVIILVAALVTVCGEMHDSLKFYAHGFTDIHHQWRIWTTSSCISPTTASTSAMLITRATLMTVCARGTSGEHMSIYPPAFLSLSLSVHSCVLSDSVRFMYCA